MVGFGYYCIVHDNLTHNYQNTILMPRIVGFVVKIVKEEHEVPKILLQCLNFFTSFFFIELSDSSSSDDLTPLPFSIKSLITIF